MQNAKNKNTKNKNEKTKNAKSGKIERVLGIYTKLINGDTIKKQKEADEYGVDERSILRDIDDIRNFLVSNADKNGTARSFVDYIRKEKGYRLSEGDGEHLTNSELLALCKILLDSRAFTKEEMSGILDKLITRCAPRENRKLVEELVLNEKFHYIEPRHKTKFINTMWSIGQAIHNHSLIEVKYLRVSDHTLKERRLQPLAIMFSEFYFYLAAIIDDQKVHENFDVINDSFPTIYRMDRIKKLTVLDEKFHIPYNDRFEEGEFRKRIQFMYGGKLQKVRFHYSGYDIDAILDRLPTAQVLREENGVYLVEAEVFGSGIEMWLGSQAKTISDVEFLR
ncbi:MAG: WYL domain-containing protein [Lachnospiraceae bacterium]|nr:WYL domain-containing protein [Lachnospiraceae bacterium]